jgi:hypothetical protein
LPGAHIQELQEGDGFWIDCESMFPAPTEIRRRLCDLPGIIISDQLQNDLRTLLTNGGVVEDDEISNRSLKAQTNYEYVKRVQVEKKKKVEMGLKGNTSTI